MFLGSKILWGVPCEVSADFVTFNTIHCVESFGWIPIDNIR